MMKITAMSSTKESSSDHRSDTSEDDIFKNVESDSDEKDDGFKPLNEHSQDIL